MTDPTDELPLHPSALVVLSALAAEPLPGVGILESAASAGRPVLGPGTLYRLLRDLRRSGWVERVDPPGAAGEADERRRYYALTGAGYRVLALETERLTSVLAQARRGLAGSGGR